MLYYVDGSKSQVGCQIAVTDIEGTLLKQEFLGEGLTNNELEYEAILVAASIAPENATILSDSNLCVQQVNGAFQIKQPRLKPYADKVKALITSKKLTLKWIPREANLAGHLLEKIVKNNARERNRKANATHKVDSEEV